MAKYKMTAKEKKDNKEFFEALRLMANERGIPQEFIAEKIADAIVVAARKDYGGSDIVTCIIDPENEIFSVVARKQIVDEVEDPFTQISRDDASAYDPKSIKEDYSKTNGFVGIADELVETDPANRKAIEFLLGRTLVCETIDHAMALAKNIQNRYKIVTLDGQVINAGGSMTGGSAAKSGGLLSRGIELEKIEKELWLRPLNEVMLEAFEHLMLMETDRRDEFIGVPSGISALDEVTSGLNKSDLIILAARPGMGKTSFALNIANHAGKHSGKNVAIFSLEMNREQLGTRMLSTECLVDNKKLITGRIAGEDEWNRVAMGVASLSQTKIYIDDDASLSVAEINAKCRRIKDLGLVIIDYLQLMTSAGGPAKANENRQQIVSDMSRSLKLMAKELNVPVICMSQLSRANESRAAGQRKPMLSDLRESGAIEQDADIVLFIHRDSYYEDDTENPNVAECIVAKNRHGETGTVMLEWRPEYTVFRNLAYNYDEEDY